MGSWKPNPDKLFARGTELNDRRKLAFDLDHQIQALHTSSDAGRMPGRNASVRIPADRGSVRLLGEKNDALLKANFADTAIGLHRGAAT
jgi:hypothetical protein